MRRPTILVLVLLALVAAACSNGNGVESGGTTTTIDARPPTTGEAAEPAPPSTAASTVPSADAGEAEEAAYRSEFYSVDHRWLCRPDLDDVCDADYDVTVIQADGSRTVEPFSPAEDPPIDCFYAYPTVAFDEAGNANIDDGDNNAEEGVAANQLARFGEVCQVYAPLYRQATLGAITGSQEPDRDLAFDDVVDSFHHYLGQWNEGRPFVLIGHSQGSGLLNKMIAQEIDEDDALRGQLVSALLIGSAVHAPPGEDVGGDFQNVPACRTADQTGCVISYASYRATPDGVVDGFFGEHSEDGDPICANPAALEGGPAEVAPLFTSDNAMQVAAGGEPIDTPWVRYPGLATVECITNDTHTYLAVTVNADPDDPRIDDVGGDFLPGWGLHIIDMNLAIDDLVAVVAQQADTLT